MIVKEIVKVTQPIVSKAIWPEGDLSRIWKIEDMNSARKQNVVGYYVPARVRAALGERREGKFTGEWDAEKVWTLYGPADG